MPFPRLSLIIGGANSGKSLFAERLCTQSGLSKAYIATAQAFDDEMRAKIKAHRDRRAPEWQTIEAPLYLVGALQQIASHQVILVDCLTLWLSNHLLAENNLIHECDGLLATLRDLKAPVVLVTNEVGMGIVPDTQLGRQFRAAQGTLNQRVAAEADLVVTVIAGLPLVLKGALP
ncbi:MAG: bifunctional adenosylcobinamide kinase/adenosylcobinamide-phosphate guanylyltransferase [Deltaproteobacteria bacterium]